MAELAPKPITDAHRVIIDAMAFLAAGRMAHDWDKIVLDVLADAVAEAKPSGVAVLDALTAAGRFIVTANALHEATRSPISRSDLAAAQLKAAAATQEFFNARIAQSATAFRGAPVDAAQPAGA